MRTLGALVLAITLAGGTDEEVVAREHVRFVTIELTGSTCHEAIGRNGEPGSARIRYQYELSGGRVGPGRFTGKVAFSLAEVVVTVPSTVAWTHMTAADREHAETLRRAIYHHEIGHVRIAEAARDELNARPALTASSIDDLRRAADAFGAEGFARFRREEREYDALTDHGRKQHEAPGVLAGPDSVVVCR